MLNWKRVGIDPIDSEEVILRNSHINIEATGKLREGKWEISIRNFRTGKNQISTMTLKDFDLWTELPDS